ncbi:MAG: hypothetical protein KKF46_01185 [Nanoarchaeota archaeon]|nr:hypothetical protein [Nanoarchaeota archaeon]MBU1320947.1 hypothetical protein [Nanoarchaeota archaeon]MBU2442084.1 hypothetical protein [Nanoarchaeota archaeon]
MKWYLLLVVVIFGAFFIASCNPGQICGDGYCSAEEDAMGYCPQDCNLEPIPKCYDTDGDDIYTKGYLTYDGKKYEDECYGGGLQLGEMICIYENNAWSMANSVRECPKGTTCTDGACRKSAIVCIDNSEPECPTGSTSASYVNNDGCQSWRCVPNPTVTCADSDGFDAYVLGRITGIDSDGNSFTISDTCGTTTNLIERVCEGQTGAMIRIPCANGCEAGRCLQ